MNVPPWERLLPPRRTMVRVGLWAGVAVAAGVVLAILEEHHLVHFSTLLPPVVLGVISGLTYGLLAVGLVLIYRTSRIINFAHGQIGAFGAAIFGLVVVKYHLPYWLMLPFGLLLGGAVGATAETVVIRRLRSAPRLMSVVATLGIAQFLILASAVINPDALGLHSLFYYPSPPGLPGFRIGALQVEAAYTGMLVLAPLAVAGTALFLRRSRFGLALRAASANPEAARMSGIHASRMSALAWAIAGALSVLSAILTQAAQGFTTGEAFGPTLLLRALAGAVLARMNNLPAALLAGVGIGVAEQLILWNVHQGGVVEVALFLLILAVLTLSRRRGGREEEKGSWAAVEATRAVPEALRRLWPVRNLGRTVALLSLMIALSLPLFITNSAADRLNAIIAFAIVGLAVGILTGLGGQLTLGQFAVAAVGALVSCLVSNSTGNFALGILSGGLAAAMVSVVLGLPAMRLSGLMLAVTTLSFALAAPTLLTAVLGAGRLPGRPVLPNGESLDTGTEYYWLALALLLLALWLVRNVRRSGFGRLLVAVRDSEDGARAFTVRASTVKLRAYVIAGFISGIGGALLGHSLFTINASTFPVNLSVDVVVMTVVGGVTSLSGPILGAVLVVGVPAFVPLDSAGLAATQLGLLLLLLYVPGGLTQLVEAVRDRLIRLLVRFVDVENRTTAAEDEIADREAPPSAATDSAVTEHSRRLPKDALSMPPRASAASQASRTPDRAGPLLDVADLRKHFGGVHAVDGVSLLVGPGETVGLIGPNGAGKTTTFELLSGFAAPDSGRILFDGRDITSTGPERRARLGLIRSFQDAALFPTMTVTECVMVALERDRPTTFLASVTGWTSAERRKELRAREVLSLMGLERYRETRIRELSTGTRRIAEIACMVALHPTLLLLDEPSSGIAQRETEALGLLLDDLKRQLGLTLLVIEHDVPLITSISDRLIAMAGGRIISTGTPAEVTGDPLVADAYLGRNSAAINRSGTTPVTRDPDAARHFRPPPARRHRLERRG
ncbi:ABC transporter permease subunit [Streptomyces sp. NPDC002285]